MCPSKRDRRTKKSPAGTGASDIAELQPSTTGHTSQGDARRRGDGYGPAASPSTDDERQQCSTSRYGPRGDAGVEVRSHGLGERSRRQKKIPAAFAAARSTPNGIGRLAESLMLAAETAKIPGEGKGGGPFDELFTGLVHVVARGTERQRNDKSDRPDHRRHQ